MSEPDYNLTNIMSNLAVRVGQLEGTLKTFMDNWARQDQIAHEGRRVMYERMDLIGKQVERVATDIQNVQQDVAEMKQEIEDDIAPTIEQVEKAQERKLGAKSVYVIILGLLTGMISGLAFIADKILSYFVHKP